MNYSDKLALIREYKNQGGKGSYLSLLQSYPEGGELPVRPITQEADNTRYQQPVLGNVDIKNFPQFGGTLAPVEIRPSATPYRNDVASRREDIQKVPITKTNMKEYPQATQREFMKQQVADRPDYEAVREFANLAATGFYIAPMGIIDDVVRGGVGLVGKGVKKGLEVAKKLQMPKSIDEAFKLNPEAYYRAIGDETGYLDAINSGIIRPNQSGIFKGRQTYYTKGNINGASNPVTGGGVKKGTVYKDDYIVEVLPNDKYFPQPTKNLNPDWNFGSTLPGNEIPSNSEFVKFYKKTKKGYLPVEVPKSNFKSEIDWAKWNKEIPENKALMQEYNTIEQQAKANGTWMKNHDGSTFQGTPEQFVQQNSENFKKAFPEGHNITYRGDRKHYPELDYNPIFTGDRQIAEYYGGEGAGYWSPFHKEGSVNSILNTNSGGIHELYYNPNRLKINIDAKGQDFIGDLKDINTGRIYSSTDDVASSIASGDKDAIITNIYDGAPYKGTVRIINHNYGSNNFMKSARGNNGMFDMTNPNIYKGVIPTIMAGELLLNQEEPVKKSKTKKK